MIQQQVNPLTLQALAGAGLVNNSLAGSLVPHLERVYGGNTGGTNHLVATDRDATRQGEAGAGMPVGVLNLPSGLTKPNRYRLQIDTKDLLNATTGPELVTIKLFDAMGYVEASPTAMAATTINTTAKISINGSEAMYEPFIKRLYSQTLFIVGMKVIVDQSGDCDCCAFPDQFNQNIKHLKINEEQQVQSQIWLSDMQNPNNYKSNIGTIGLTEAQMRLDRETAWIWEVYTGQMVTIELLVAAYEHNS